ncbi:MAG: hypothetical protein AB7L28_07410 [Kofleriaceae bacterium]
MGESDIVVSNAPEGKADDPTGATGTCGGLNFVSCGLDNACVIPWTEIRVHGIYAEGTCYASCFPRFGRGCATGLECINGDGQIETLAGYCGVPWN